MPDRELLQKLGGLFNVCLQGKRELKKLIITVLFYLIAI
jgi:hypothetical protein